MGTGSGDGIQTTAAWWWVSLILRILIGFPFVHERDQIRSKSRRPVGICRVDLRGSDPILRTRLASICKQFDNRFLRQSSGGK